MSQPSRRRLRIETNGETGRVRDDCVFQWVNRNEYLEYFVGGKGGRCVGLTNLPPSCLHVLIVKKYGTFTLLAPQEPVQAWQRLVTVAIDWLLLVLIGYCCYWLVTVAIATTTTTTSTAGAVVATTSTTNTTTTSATYAIVCHEPCPVLPLPSMLPILQLSPPILKALSLPSVFFHQISLPNSSSLSTRPLLSVVWSVSLLQVFNYIHFSQHNNKSTTIIFKVYSYMFQLTWVIFRLELEDDSHESKHVAINYKYNC